MVELTSIYQTVGDRLGEANTLQAQGDLETDPNIAIAKYQTARQTDIEIGDKFKVEAFSPSFCLNPCLIAQVHALWTKEF